MTKHKRHDMIVAKAANMDLVVFFNDGTGWHEGCLRELVCCDYNFFLCLPQHKEACLHWLNGGLIERQSKLTSEWEGCADSKYSTWIPLCGMMRGDEKYRIKPRKGKRYIVVHEYNVSGPYRKIHIAKMNQRDHGGQLIEIEVEVK